VLAQTSELEAPLTVPKRRGLITRGKVLEEIKRLRRKAGKVRRKHHERREGPRRSWATSI
jgi:hypothetical protein